MSAYSSGHPDVLSLWQELDAQHEIYTQTATEIEEITGRKILVRIGFGDSIPFALECGSKDGDLLPGWKYGKNSDRWCGYMVPRARGPEARAAQALIKRLQSLHPKPLRHLREAFGAPDVVFDGGRSITPCAGLLAGELWLFYGPRETEWHGTPYFTKRPLSAYYLAKETEAAADAHSDEIGAAS